MDLLFGRRPELRSIRTRNIDEMSARTARRRMTSPVGLGGRHSQLAEL
jgi:hypothetical protein